MTDELQPNFDDMVAHLRFLFTGIDPDALIEICWTTASDKRPKLSNARLFKADQLEAAAAEALVQNKRGANVYVGACPRKPNTAPFARAGDRDVLGVQTLWCDWDVPGCAENAKHLWVPLPPSLQVVTGTHPHGRMHGWWRLDQLLTDVGRASAALSSMAAEMNADANVCNVGRVMRLAGTIAWPMHKPGRIPELTHIRTMRQPGKPAHTIEELEKRFATTSTVKEVISSGLVRASLDLQASGAAPLNSLGLTLGTLDDGRERYMLNTVLACLREFIGEHGAVPDAEELFEAAWPQYAEHVDFSRPGRREDEMLDKCRAAVRRFGEGKIEGLRDLDEAVATHQARKLNGHASPATAPLTSEEPADYFPATSFIGEPEARRWVVNEWIPAGVVSTLYGDGGVGKTLLAQQLLYAASVGGKWLGMDVTKGTALGVLCEDERGELHRRHQAIAQGNGQVIGNPYASAFLWPRVGRDNLLVAFDRDHKPQTLPFFKSLHVALAETNATLLVLDTLADLFGGSEIDRTQVNYFVKAICGGFIRTAATRGVELTVLLLGHPSLTGQNTGTGLSGSTAWNNAVRSRLYLTKPDDGLKNARLLTRKKANYAASGDDECIELLWIDGVMMPTFDKTNDNERLAIDSAKSHILRRVKERWDASDPYKAKRTKLTTGRFLDACMMEELTPRGVKPQAVHAALRGLKTTGEIVVTKARDKRGWALRGSEGNEVE